MQCRCRRHAAMRATCLVWTCPRGWRCAAARCPMRWPGLGWWSSPPPWPHCAACWGPCTAAPPRWPGCARALRPRWPKVHRACWPTKCTPRWRPACGQACSAAPASPRKWPWPNPPRWWPPANTPTCATPWCAPSTAPACVSMPTTISWVWKWAAPSRTCWPLPPACATACNWGSMRGPRSSRVAWQKSPAWAWPWARAPKPSWACRAWATWC